MCAEKPSGVVVCDFFNLRKNGKTLEAGNRIVPSVQVGRGGYGGEGMWSLSIVKASVNALLNKSAFAEESVIVLPAEDFNAHE